MPYELSFRKAVQVEDPGGYINACCHGGDVVAEHLGPALRKRFDLADAVEEDWGWFLWFREGDVKLAVDIFCDDPAAGAFRVHLTSRRTRWWRFEHVVDTPELEEVRAIVEDSLSGWADSVLPATKLDDRYMPL